MNLEYNFQELREQFSKEIVNETKKELSQKMETEVTSDDVSQRMDEFLSRSIQMRLQQADIYKNRAIDVDRNSGDIDANPIASPFITKYKDELNSVKPLISFLEYMHNPL